ncbi:MAG: hypothetical protein WCS37_17940 [Chloroflexota bacterium]
MQAFTKTAWLMQEISGELASGRIAQNDGLGSMIIRITLFMVGLLVFCLICGLAWRKIPGLHALLSVPQTEEPPTSAEPYLLIKSAPLEKAPDKSEYDVTKSIQSNQPAEGEPRNEGEPSNIADNPPSLWRVTNI